MSRRMSCALTTQAVRERRKTVTRRHDKAWGFLRPGDRLTLVEKGMGLPKGAKQVILAEVEVVDVRVEGIFEVDEAEVEREGLDMTPEQFVDFWLKSHGYKRWHNALCRRIEWRYLDGPQEMVRVEQTILANAHPEVPGNCLQAAVATVLGRDLETVPHFVWAAGSHWLAAVKGWADDRGLSVTYAATTEGPSWPCVLLGMSPRGVQHAVAWDGGRVIDPHPEQSGLDAITHLIEFKPKEDLDG